MLEREEHVDVGVFDAQDLDVDGHFELAAHESRYALGNRKAKAHTIDPFAESPERLQEPALHVGSLRLGQRSAGSANMDLHCVADGQVDGWT